MKIYYNTKGVIFSKIKDKVLLYFPYALDRSAQSDLSLRFLHEETLGP